MSDVITEWHEVGIYIDLPEHILKPIGSNLDVEGRVQISDGVQVARLRPPGQLEQASCYLECKGKNMIAASIRSKYVRADSETQTACWRMFHFSSRMYKFKST